LAVTKVTIFNIHHCSHNTGDNIEAGHGGSGVNSEVSGHGGELRRRKMAKLTGVLGWRVIVKRTSNAGSDCNTLRVGI
jgi:hypothetical protein